jgi:hypothetical protein
MAHGPGIYTFSDGKSITGFWKNNIYEVSNEVNKIIL